MYLMKTKKLFPAVCLFSLIILIPTAIFAQESKEGKAQLLGIILNENKELLSNVKVQLKHEESGKTFQSVSNEKGRFASPVLPPGKHILLVEKEEYKSYTTELELQPNIVQTLEIILAKGEFLEQKQEKQEKEAVEFFKKGVKLAGEEKADDATRAFQKAVELKPDFEEAYLNLGIFLFQQQKDDEAEKALLKALELNPDESRAKQVLADVNYEQAKVLIGEENMDKALEKLEQSYSFRQDHALVNFLMGYVYSRKQMNDEAIKHLEAFIQLAPESPQVEMANEILKSLKEKK